MSINNSKPKFIRQSLSYTHKDDESLSIQKLDFHNNNNVYSFSRTPLENILEQDYLGRTGQTAIVNVGKITHKRSKNSKRMSTKLNNIVPEEQIRPTNILVKRSNFSVNTPFYNKTVTLEKSIRQDIISESIDNYDDPNIVECPHNKAIGEDKSDGFEEIENISC